MPSVEKVRNKQHNKAQTYDFLKVKDIKIESIRKSKIEELFLKDFRLNIL